MKKNRRVLFHLLFWITYFGINLFNEVYLSESFTSHPSAQLFFESALTQFLVLLIKVPAVYYVLYSLIPRWLKAPAKIKLYFECAVVIFLFVIAYRLMIQQVIWKHVYHETQEVPPIQVIARFFYSLLDLLQVVAIAAAIKLFRLRTEALKNEKILVQEKLQSEMLHLKAQINPHFLFNSLNSIYSLTRSRSDVAPETVMRLSKILRYMLYETEKKTSSIEDELKIIDDYMELQKLRFGNSIKVNFTKSIDNNSSQVAPLLLLPLIENAFKHGSSNGASQIDFRIELMKNNLVVQVKNPVGEPSVKLNGEEGIGLSNIQRQLELLYRDYSFQHHIDKNIFVADLQINLASYAGYELFDSRR
ncbi:MAG TPA: histidine kinase [Bacteroidia bacterium]|nr:histidine kinase [Bacteroidia bacterium]